VEFSLLRRALHKRIGAVPPQRSRTLRLWGAAFVAAAAGYGLKVALPVHAGHYTSLIVGAVILPLFGVLYLGLVHVMGIGTPASLQRLMRRG
jgi:putative peptidoglycan lipid II flippase